MLSLLLSLQKIQFERPRVRSLFNVSVLEVHFKRCWNVLETVCGGLLQSLPVAFIRQFDGELLQKTRCHQKGFHPSQLLSHAHPPPCRQSEDDMLFFNRDLQLFSHFLHFCLTKSVGGRIRGAQKIAPEVRVFRSAQPPDKTKQQTNKKKQLKCSDLPNPKGRIASDLTNSPLSLRNRDGSNASGFGKTLGFMCAPCRLAIITVFCAGILNPRNVVLFETLCIVVVGTKSSIYAQKVLISELGPVNAMAQDGKNIDCTEQLFQPKSGGSTQREICRLPNRSTCTHQQTLFCALQS